MVKRQCLSSASRTVPSAKRQKNLTACTDENTAVECKSSTIMDLPVELIYYIFDFLSVTDLGKISNVSRSFLRSVHCYLEDVHGHIRLLSLISPGFDDETLKENYKILGRLLKRISALRSPARRLIFFSDFCSKLNIDIFTRRPDRKFCSYLIGTFINGWQDNEVHRIFSFFDVNFKLKRKVDKVLLSKCGEHSVLEADIRSFILEVYFGSSRTFNSLRISLSVILRSLTIWQQAKLIFLLYGPYENGVVLWESVLYQQGPLYMKGLRKIANCLQSLPSINNLWTPEEVITLYDELIHLPRNWHPENAVYTMLVMGDALCIKMLCSKAINGKFLDVAHFVCTMLVLGIKCHFSFPSFVRIIHVLCRSVTQNCAVTIIHSICDCICEQILSLDTSIFDQEILVAAQGEFMKTALKCIAASTAFPQ